ncbi:MAG: maltose ABC transporter substrate-binding protein [Paenibacillus macerans]|uniref:sugar ABC transporter substrate-binding protein n=1 Tax=Paenibacillus TaxID=44249 RepID=UPI00055BF1D7|nr:maltose ABC transporter substrate-binding protein [Paenibacillus macerans]MCY7561485.1 maltose ABC transporter substrate-binding protein [Paenibacillus macerans]MDU7476243.1 maltose ABC transporter substrate-binding protein [Paenibacillus macerans]MEC0138742.1 maltose ABC transporter substrate-binding protein [Paenibacillus macerans]MEC0153920.1 maltose ABC transporter substrate-binding protein [Paenibacillus macerans]MEC0332806.1 maltose ABC transporter substrate-binding protein [Paenibaci
MTKSKKILTLIAALTLAVSITACGPSNNGGTAAPPNQTGNTGNTGAGENVTADTIVPEDGAELVIWESKEELAFTEEIAKQFTEKYGVNIKIEEVAPTDQIGKLTQDGPAGLAADVLIVPHDHLGNAATSGLILANDVFGEETAQSNTEVAVQGATYDGVLYGYPRAAETMALYYNKSLVPEAPKDFKDVLAFGKTFTDKAKNKFAIMWETGNMYFNYPFIASGGGYLFGEGGTNPDDIGLAKDGAIEGLKVFQSLREILPINSGDINADVKRSLFSAGDIAMDINGPWELAGYKAALGDNLGVALYPTVDGKTAITFSGAKVWVVNSFTQYPNAAKMFAHFASTKDAQLLLYEKVGAVPTNLEALASDQIKNDPYVSVFAEQAKNSQPMPSIPEMSNVWAPMNAALPEIWNNNADPKTTMEKTVAQITDLNKGVAQ